MDYNHYEYRQSQQQQQNPAMSPGKGGNNGQQGAYPPGSNGLNQKTGHLENPAIKGLQSLRRNSIQRKIFEQQLRQAETTQCVNQAFNSVRPITQGHQLAPPTLPTRKLSASTPNLTLIIDPPDQMLNAPQSYHSQPGSSSPMRVERSLSPRMSPYQVLSPSASSAHLSDMYGSMLPVDQMSGMRLGSPQPSCMMSVSPGPVSYMNDGHPHQASPMSGNFNNGYASSVFGGSSGYGSVASPESVSSGHGRSMGSQIDPMDSDGLQRELEHMLDNMLNGNKFTNYSNLPANPPNGFNGTDTGYGRNRNTGSFNGYDNRIPAPVPLQMNKSAPPLATFDISDSDYGIQFPLPDEEVSPYGGYDGQSNSANAPVSMDWNSAGQNLGMPSSSKAQPTNTPNDPRYNSNQIQPMNDWNPQEIYGRPRVASMPSLNMRTTATNRAAFCGSTVVERSVIKSETPPVNTAHPGQTANYSIPSITVTTEPEGFDEYLAKPNTCDDLISFLTNWDGSGGDPNAANGNSQQQQQPTAPPGEKQNAPGRQAVLPMSEYQERWLLADDFARKELGLAGTDPDL